MQTTSRANRQALLTPSRILLILSLASIAIACGDDDSSVDAGPARDAASADVRGVDGGPVSTCGSASRSGETTCTTSVSGVCSAGQYCDDVMLQCSPGCTSDANCGPTDQCIRAAGESVGACAACPRCGDAVCQPTESAASCPADCASAVCGDGTCQASESPASCPGDCSATAVCGDGTCQASESPASCPGDCPATAVCGDGTCQASESEASCPGDCAVSSFEGCLATCEQTGTCGATPGQVDACRAECGDDTFQREVAECLDDDCRRVANCFGIECFGDAQCSVGSCVNAHCCGNGVCDPDFEDETICPADCSSDFLAECYEECEGFAFFGCGTGCRDACTASTPDRRVRFLECGDPTACNYDECASLL